MKNILPFCFLFLFMTAAAQEQISLKFVRPSSAQGADDKIQLSIQGNDYLIKNGSTISVNVTPDYKSSLKIDCNLPNGLQTSYFLDPKPAQSYEFEVGFKMNGIYIKLVSGEEAKQGEQAQQANGENKNEQWNTNLKVDRSNKSIGFNAEKTGQTESIREEWLRRGGKVRYTSILLNGLYFRVDMGKPGVMNGYGGGYSVYINNMNLKIPEYKTGTTNWNTFNWGLGYDFDIYGFSYNMNSGTTKMNMSSTIMTIMITGNFGWTFGFGKFIDEGNWKGVALTLKYRPSFNLNVTGSTVKMTMPAIPGYSTKPTTTTTASSNTTNQFNAKGFGFDLDFSNYSATMNKLAPRPRSKFSFFVLPPVGSSPLFISFSYGLSFYSRARVHAKR